MWMDIQDQRRLVVLKTDYDHIVRTDTPVSNLINEQFMLSESLTSLHVTECFPGCLLKCCTVAFLLKRSGSKY